ncbi:hypothetical protein K491DRAFT_696012 [Lophiostoma macrostomum CBS 122681]|uniref:Ribosomal protein/NADH dehydrogenase domain-containing protein n=1 Tax=Lophiostoma macrostomum CBS 122681 TaxID=1314788 RepID=A0A6A6SWL0_9PLEO|nr:hypothetical protein K491DRAFT_696012 [Lophiostoma macrostomum CBS 122681]
MVALIKRMRNLRELLWVRIGPGALLLPKEVTKLGLEFSKNKVGGHMGPRKFWREMLPRIKFHNPTIPVEIRRHNTPTGPALLHIYTSTSSDPTPAASDISVSDTTASTPPSSTPNPRDTQVPTTATPAHTVDIKSADELDILAQLVSRTGATEIKATPEEAAEMAEIKEFNVRREKDRVEVREKLAKERREEELLRLARGEVSAAA